jgi:trans-aconitate methyltransferase
MARAEVAKRGLSNVTVLEADAFHTGLEKNAYDLVHERLVLNNVPARDALLAEMLSLLRPGGTLALEDPDNASWLCEPSHPSWDVLRDAFAAVFQAAGGDEAVGRKLPALLRRAGVQTSKYG